MFGNALARNEAWRLISIQALMVGSEAKQKMYARQMEAYTFLSYILSSASCDRNTTPRASGRSREASSPVATIISRKTCRKSTEASWSYCLLCKPTSVFCAYTRNTRTSVIPLGIASYSLERFAPRVCVSISSRNAGSKLPLLATGRLPPLGGTLLYHRLLTSAALAAVLLKK